MATPDFPRTLRFRTAALTLTLVLTAGAPGSSLIERSPFLPPDTPTVQAPPAQAVSPLAGRFEFRGFYELNGEIKVLIKEKSQPSGRWVRLDEFNQNGGFTASAFDRAARAVTVSADGQTARISLASAQIGGPELPISGQRQVAAGPPAPPVNRVGNASVANAENLPAGRTDRLRRRVPPPAPQWIRDRMAAGSTVEEATREMIGQPPNFIPQAPPAFTPSVDEIAALEPPQLPPEADTGYDIDPGFGADGGSDQVDQGNTDNDFFGPPGFTPPADFPAGLLPPGFNPGSPGG